MKQGEFSKRKFEVLKKKVGVSKDNQTPGALIEKMNQKKTSISDMKPVMKTAFAGLI